MRVMVVGGAGAFGSRLCTMLRRDGHEVTIVGRSAASRETAHKLGVAFLRADLSADLDSLMVEGPEVIVDASGPFQLYGEDPYRLPRFCISKGVHYLDLSDDGAFTQGIAQLDESACRAGVAVISGASSVPAISSAAVMLLSRGMTALTSIESAIMPGNKAPRGRSVIASILSQVGRPMTIQREGRPEQVIAWSERADYELAAGIARPAWLIGAPDLLLFPEAFHCPNVAFRAGMESGLLNAAVSAYAWLARRGLAPRGDRIAGLAAWTSGVLAPGGTDVGGMIVEVSGQSAGTVRRRRWTLVARDGHGPFIPAIPVRVLLRRAELEAGARACVGEIAMDEIEKAFSDLAIETSVGEIDEQPVFRRAAGDAWQELPAEIRALHEFDRRAVFTGTAVIERGRNPLARLVGLVMDFPRAGTNVPVRVTKTRNGGRETWLRDFAGSRFLSVLENGRSEQIVFETFGPLRFQLALAFRHDGLSIEVVSGRMFGVPMPRFLLPSTVASESVVAGRFRFDVALQMPMGLGLIIRYSGDLAAA